MYPSGSLRILERRKARLEIRIAARRMECVAECRLLVQPIERIELWRERLSRWSSYLPLALAAFSAWRHSSAKPLAEPPRRRGVLGWLPVVAEGIRAYRKLSGAV